MSLYDDENDYHDRGRETVRQATSLWGKLPKIAKILIGGAVSTVAVLILVAIISAFFTFQTLSGMNYHVQNTLFGTERIITKAGVHFKMPIFTTVTSYKQVFTITYEKPIGRTEKGISLFKTKGASITKDPIKVLFADTYTADIPGTFRFKLPMKPDQMIKIHHEFRGFENLANSLIEKTSMDVMINTATQYTGEEFLLGAINQFKASVSDQLRNGIYVTERRKVEVDEASLAPVGIDQQDSNKLQQTKKLVWKTVPLTNADKSFKRQENPLAQYGIVSTQFTMGRPIPEPQLETLLTDKKALVAERIKTVQEQETAKEKAKTAQLLAEIDRTKAKQLALKNKDLAIIAMQQQVEEAEKQADKEKVEQEKVKSLALIQKQQELEVEEYNRKTLVVKKNKELDVATANKGIQKAEYEAAQFEAKAIKEVGLAEAAVQEAKYKAYDVELYTQELQKDVAIQLYRNLGNFKVQMPTIVSGDNSGGLPNNLKILSDFAALGALEKAKNLQQ